MKESLFNKKQEKIDIPENNTEGVEIAMGMIRATLMLNPENQKLSPEEIDRLVVEEYKESLD